MKKKQVAKKTTVEFGFFIAQFLRDSTIECIDQVVYGAGTI